MKKLAEKEYWDSVYADMRGERGSSSVYRFKNWLKNISRDYSNYVMWEVLIPRYLPEGEGKIIEVGCAPGKYLLSMHKRYGYEPYGVEYSEKGTEITRSLFVKNGLHPQNVLQTDFFDAGFAQENNGKYDVVFSRGFIEHYDDVKSVVLRHMDLVKPGGYVVISIPNLAGINKLLAKIFNIDSYNLHNTSIMRKEEFSDLFPVDKVEHLYSGYVGIFSFGLFNTNARWKYIIHRILLVLQRPVDFLLRILLPGGYLRCRYSGPYLLFVGRKR